MQTTRAKTIHSLSQLIKTEVKTQGWRFALYFAVIALSGALSIIPPKFYGFFAENIGGMQNINDASAREFLNNLFLFGSFIAVTLLISYVMRTVTEEWISLRIEGSLRTRFMSFMHRMPLEGFDESQRGDWLTRMSGDIRAVEQFIALRLPNQISDAVVTIAIASVFLTQNVIVASFLILTSIFLAVGNLLLQHKLTPILESLRNLHGEVFQGLLENFEGLRSIRSYRAENFVVSNFNSRVHSIIDKGLHLIKRVGLLVGTNSFLVNFFTTLTLCFVAFKLRSKDILLSDVFLYPFYIGMFYTSVFALIRGVFDWNDFMVHAKRLDDVFQSGSSHSYVANETYTNAFDSLEVKDAVIAYEGFSKLTHAFDFKIQTGECVIIRGHSGCGKSTFVESLAGLRKLEVESAQLCCKGLKVESFTKQEGKICLPVDLCTYVEQKAYLLEGTLRDNLLLGKSSSDEELWFALQNVNLDSFFRSKEGLDFQIKDNGRNLSEGQKQRVGIARSFLHLRPLIVLDEPFASLDHESIAVLCKKLSSLKARHGIVIVTHMIPDSLSFDRVVDFDQFSVPNASKELESEKFDANSLRHLAGLPFRTLAKCN